MRHHQQCTLPRAPTRFQVSGQPRDGAHVQVVRGFVERQHIPVADEQPHKVDPAALPTGQRANACVPRNVGGQPRDDVANARVARPLVLRQVAHHGALDGVVVGQRVGLAQHPHVHRAVLQHAPVVGIQRAGQQVQQRGLPVAVAAHDANAVTLLHAQRHAVEHRLRGEFHPHLLATQQKRHVSILRIRTIAFHDSLPKAQARTQGLSERWVSASRFSRADIPQNSTITATTNATVSTSPPTTMAHTAGRAKLSVQPTPNRSGRNRLASSGLK